MMRALLFLSLSAWFLMSFKPTYSIQGEPVKNVKLSAEEMALYQKIMEYRKTLKLPVIPISASLTFVAQSHVWDLNTNKPDKGNCNLHSWSNKGKWKACCYTSDHKQAQCMWNKPSELSSYPGYGYEISTWSSGQVTAASAIESWKSSPGHNGVMANIGMWKSMQWKSIGIGLIDHYAVVWFGTDADPVPYKP